MGLNQNHIVEELGGTRCAIVEKNISQERANFLTKILTGNGYTVVCAEAAAPKSASATVASVESASATEASVEAKAPVLLNLGVTDVKFNPINAIYGRILTAENGSFVTPDYWHQKEAVSNDQKPYFEK
jgi:hypothetical protein